MLLSIDPSSTRTGWAIGDTEIVAAGAITGRGKDYVKRSVNMKEKLCDLICNHDVTRVIIEIPNGKTHGRLHGKNISGLPVYGFAVGMLYSILEYHFHDINYVDQNTWTRGHNKTYRKPIAMQLYPEYANMTDSGGDIADAICLWDWHKKQELVKGEK